MINMHMYNTTSICLPVLDLQHLDNGNI